MGDHILESPWNCRIKFIWMVPSGSDVVRAILLLARMFIDNVSTIVTGYVHLKNGSTRSIVIAIIYLA